MAFVSMKTPHSDQPFGWKVCEVETSLTEDGATGTYDVETITLPQGTIVLSGQIVCTQAEAGATTTTVDLEAGAGGTNVLTGASDNLGTVYAAEAMTAGELIILNAALSVGDVTLNAEVTISGTATTAPKFLVAVECGRTSY